MLTTEISYDDMQLLFAEFGIWSKIESSCLESEIIVRDPATNPNYQDCTSEIIKHFDTNGKHIATTHRIIKNSDNSIVHWDAKDILFDNIRIYRTKKYLHTPKV